MSEPINGEKLWQRLKDFSEEVGLGRPIHVPDFEERVRKSLQSETPRVSEPRSCTCYVLPHADDCEIFVGLTKSGERVMERRSGADRRVPQPNAAPQPPVTPHRSMPGLGESPDSANGGNSRQPCETGSGDMAAVAAPSPETATNNRGEQQGSESLRSQSRDSSARENVADCPVADPRPSQFDKPQETAEERRQQHQLEKIDAALDELGAPTNEQVHGPTMELSRVGRIFRVAGKRRGEDGSIVSLAPSHVAQRKEPVCGECGRVDGLHFAECSKYGIPEGRRSPPAGALGSGSPFDVARDANPSRAGDGGGEERYVQCSPDHPHVHLCRHCGIALSATALRTEPFVCRCAGDEGLLCKTWCGSKDCEAR